MTMPLRKNPDAYAETEIDDEVVLMDLSNGDFFSITDTGLAIWNLIDGNVDRAGLIARLALDYGAAEAEIAGDVDEFLAAVSAAGFVAAD